MKPNRRIAFSCAIILSSAVACHGRGGATDKGASEEKDPSRCVIRDYGEATDFLERRPVPSNLMVRLHGIGHPKALVWRDSEQNRTFYITRVMGTEQKLFYLTELRQGAAPGVPSSFEGHLVYWRSIPSTKSAPIASALDRKYGIRVDQENSLVIDATSRPEGCPRKGTKKTE